MNPVFRETVVWGFPGFCVGVLTFVLFRIYFWHIQKLKELNAKPHSDPEEQRAAMSTSTAPNGVVISDIKDAPQILIDEAQRQMLIRALAVNSLLDPGFEYCSREIAKLYYAEKMYDNFRRCLADRFNQSDPVPPPARRSAKGREELISDDQEASES